nr:alpha/beta hydrolase [Clostridium felsineum]
MCLNSKIFQSKYKEVFGTLYASEDSKALVIIFPGINYDHNKPLLYYAKKAAVQNNNDVLCISYKDKISWEDIGKASTEDVASEIAYIIEKLINKNYKSIYFLGKSIGTQIAGLTASKLNIHNIEFIYLTPIEQTLKYIIDRKCTVVVGTKDEFFEGNYINTIKEHKSVSLMLFEGANHSLEIKNDVIKNLRILENVVKLYVDFFK